MAHAHHVSAIARLRSGARPDTTPDLTDDEIADLLAADLLELHEAEAISLDHWIAGREFVERRADLIVGVNGA